MQLTTLMLALCLTVPALAQETTKEDSFKFYRLDFVVKELDESKVVSSKKYTTFANTDGRGRSVCSVRTGNRVPYRVSAGPAPTNFQYVDIGVNIDCVGPARDWNGQVMLTLAAEVSTVPSGSDGTPNTLPLVRQNKWNSTVVFPIGKPTTVFSSDDLNSNRKMQLELTATQIK